MLKTLLVLLSLVKQPLVRLVSSAKFWTVIIGLVATWAAKHGIVLDPKMADDIAGGFALLLAAQGLTDHGKAKAEVEQRNVQSGIGALPLMLAVVVAGLFAVTAAQLAGCSWTKADTKALVANAVDCTTSKVADAGKEYGPSVELALRSQLSDTGKIDRAGLKSLARSFVTDTGQCVFVKEVTRLLMPRGNDSQSTPLPIDTLDVGAAWNEVWRDELGGKQFKLEDPRS